MENPGIRIIAQSAGAVDVTLNTMAVFVSPHPRAFSRTGVVSDAQMLEPRGHRSRKKDEPLAHVSISTYHCLGCLVCPNGSEARAANAAAVAAGTAFARVFPQHVCEWRTRPPAEKAYLTKQNSAGGELTEISTAGPAFSCPNLACRGLFPLWVSCDNRCVRIQPGDESVAQPPIPGGERASEAATTVFSVVVVVGNCAHRPFPTVKRGLKHMLDRDVAAVSQMNEPPS